MVDQQQRAYTPIIGFVFTGITQTPIYGAPVVVDGLRLVDARASYGIGLETFALGFPIHFDWAWKTLFNKDWEDALFAAVRRKRRVPQAEVLGLDWVRLLIDRQFTVHGPPRL